VPDIAANRLVVQQSFPDPRPTTNPYIVMLRDAIRNEPEVELRTFGWRRAVFGRYDVFHAHWPEILVGGQNPLKALVRQALTVALLVKLRTSRVPIVRTVHNLELPSGLNRRQIWILRWFDRQTTLRIRLNTSTDIPASVPHVTILHGHYRDWFAQYSRAPAIPGRLGYFGLIRRYKAVDSLIVAFRDLAGDLSLRIAGKPSTPELAAAMEDLASADDRVILTLKFLTDEELVTVATESELVVLPYREMHNSGGALAALSVDRPILVPQNDANKRLSEEVGMGWVFQYEGALSTEHLRTALIESRASVRSPSPDLSAREWANVGRLHVEAYRRAVSLLRP
jgi:glycosyltransferase involved in cell wall biosynthesis